MLVTFGILARTLLSPKVHWRLLTLVGGKEGANRAMTTKGYRAQLRGGRDGIPLGVGIVLAIRYFVGSTWDSYLLLVFLACVVPLSLLHSWRLQGATSISPDEDNE